MVWEKALDSIKKEIEVKGYYKWTESYQRFKEAFKIEAKQRAPQYLSIDFWSQQRKELTDHGLYVIRFGMGNFIIFSEDEFPRPYTDLKSGGAEEIPIKEVVNHPVLKRAYSVINSDEKSAENTLLELLTFNDVYSRLVQLIDGSDRYYIGPRGGMTSSFNVYLMRKTDAPERFAYRGQVELDYTIWTENRAYIFEAKSTHKTGFDIGWHKLAYPAQRFAKLSEESGFKLTPVYFLRKKTEGVNIIYLFVFPPVKFNEGGVILNDKAAMTPEKTFKIDLSKLGI
ncbi:MAG: hypothetical protein WC941_08365 [Candidatus Bathyarchaeia archaeon]